MLSSEGGNSGSMKFFIVLSNSFCSISSKLLSARGNILNVFFDLSMRDLRLA